MKIKLLKPHEHAGRDYIPGAVIEVDKDTAEWLIANGVAEPADKPKSK
jgi:hypothetical protein